MFDFAPADAADKSRLYADLLTACSALVGGERDPVANMANVSALLWQWLPDLNWAGFYRILDGELVLGPFQGKPACTRIALGKGVCGTAALEQRTVIVEDVHTFPGHIACDAASASEIVVPVIANKALLAVLDLDSPSKARFDEADAAGLETLLRALSENFAP